jgi:hypothetical protein
MFEFEETYGPYHELKGASKVEYIRPFDEVNSDNFRDQVNGIKYVGY